MTMSSTEESDVINDFVLTQPVVEGDTLLYRHAPGFWIQHNRHLTASKAAAWAGLSEYHNAKGRREIIHDVSTMWNKNHPPPDPHDSPQLEFGRQNQMNSILEYLRLTNRLSSATATTQDLEDRLKKVQEEMTHDNFDSRTFRTVTRFALTPRATMQAFPDNTFEGNSKHMANAYNDSPFLSSSPAGTILDADGNIGLLLIQSFYSFPDVALESSNLTDEIRPKFDQWLQAIVALLCHSSAQFVDIVINSTRWMWIFRLERNDDDLKNFLVSFAPLIFQFGQLRFLVNKMYDANNMHKDHTQREIDHIKQVKAVDYHNLRTAVYRYRGLHELVKVVVNNNSQLAWGYYKDIPRPLREVKHATMFSKDSKSNKMYGWRSFNNGQTIERGYCLISSYKAFAPWDSS